jgi:hypothetical protein
VRRRAIVIKGVRENCAALLQGEVLLESLTDSQYVEIVSPVFDSAMGAHFRHNLDHYACFLEGLDSSVIDYTARSRRVQLERCRQSALRASRQLRQALQGLRSEQANLYLLTDGAAGRVRTLTSAERELEFLLSHTVHHYAIVAVICRLQGLSVPPDFGVAPSTLRHRAALRAETDAASAAGGPG